MCITGTHSAKIADTVASTLEEVQKTLNESYGVEAYIDHVMPGRVEGEPFPCQSLILVSDEQNMQFECNMGEGTLVYAWTHAFRIYSIDLASSAFFKMIEKNEMERKSQKFSYIDERVSRPPRRSDNQE